MKETLAQSAGRRKSFGVLLIVLAAGIGVLAWMRMPDEGRSLAPRPSSLAPPPCQSLQEILDERDNIPSHHHALLGRRAPDFELAHSDGKRRTLGQLRDGRPAVLIFYYGYHCIHCARQLADIDRDLPLFQELGARIIAIRADAPELTRRRFGQNGPFGFPALADPDNKIAERYGVFMRAREETGTDIRRHGTFVIDGNGTVRWVNVGDGPLRRNSALLYQLAKMEGRLR